MIKRLILNMRQLFMFDEFAALKFEKSVIRTLFLSRKFVYTHVAPDGANNWFSFPYHTKFQACCTLVVLLRNNFTNRRLSQKI